MKEITWDEYYDGFYDWSPSTQKSYSYGLTDFGPADEVYEVLSEFAFSDKKFATRFADKAVTAGVRFSPDHVLEMVSLVEKPVLIKMAEQTSSPFDKEQLEEIYILIEDASFERIAQKAKIDIFADDNSEEPEETFATEDDFNIEMPPQKKPGFFATIAAVIAGVSLADRLNQKRHNGRCDGDCANCPPHYGYRYGRWYYGHDHAHGCEFGGNKGSGSRD
jgi:hypothetical protein